MDILDAISALKRGDSPSKVASGLGLEVDEADVLVIEDDEELDEMASSKAAVNIAKGKQKWRATGPRITGKKNDDIFAVAMLREMAKRPKRPLRYNEIFQEEKKKGGAARNTLFRALKDKLTGKAANSHGKSEATAIPQMLIGAGLVGKLRQGAYLLTPRGIAWTVQNHMMSKQQARTLLSDPKMQKASGIAKQRGAEYQPRARAGAQGAQSLKNAFGKFASDSPEATTFGSSPGKFGFHLRKLRPDVEEYRASVTLSLQKLNIRLGKLSNFIPHVFYGKSQLPDLQSLDLKPLASLIISNNAKTADIVRAAMKGAGMEMISTTAKITGIQTNVNMGDDIIIEFDVRFPAKVSTQKKSSPADKVPSGGLDDFL